MLSVSGEGGSALRDTVTLFPDTQSYTCMKDLARFIVLGGSIGARGHSCVGCVFNLPHPFFFLRLPAVLDSHGRVTCGFSREGVVLQSRLAICGYRIGVCREIQHAKQRTMTRYLSLSTAIAYGGCLWHWGKDTVQVLDMGDTQLV